MNIMPATMTECEFQRQVIRLAGLLGWSCYHTHDSRRSQPGFPDLVLAKPGRGVLFVELKSESGRIRPEQQEWMTTLAEAGGVRVFLWRPADLQSIADTLGA